jgi:dolichol-phosphate mannosyltransferase
VWLGLNQAFVPYERAARHAGQSHFPLVSRNPWKTFVLGVTSFSFVPIYACVALAAAGLVASSLMLIVALAPAIAGAAVDRGTALMAVLTFFWATTVGAIGVVGIYIARIYKDVRARPAYVLQSTIGLSERDAQEDRTHTRETEAIAPRT